MEIRIKRFLLRLIKCSFLATALFNSLLALADDERPIIEPDVVPQKVDEALIDTENFEAGLFVGTINIEDFETSMLYGVRLAYHLSELFFLESNIGFAEGGETSFEKLSGNTRLLSDAEREYRFYNLGFGYNLFPGEAFFKSWFSDKTYAFNSNFYLLAGAGATDFAGDNRFTATFGAGYQVILNDAV
ncbi:outer membrane beta-barrel domain-containing protein, partial [Oleiphilus sp. HI0080]